MFFIMGINRGQKQLDFDQVEVCPNCGKFGHIKVFLVYTYLMFFFIPVFKWNKRYFVRMSCCSGTAELDQETGKGIEDGRIHQLNIQNLDFGSRNNSTGENTRKCPSCGYTTTENFTFCPRCGNRLEEV